MMPPQIRESCGSLLVREASRKNAIAFPGVGASSSNDEYNQPINLHSYLFKARRRSGWTPSFLYEHADTDTWQKGLVETCKTNVGVAEGWLTLRAPTQDFFDHRRLEELSAAEWARAAGGVAMRRPGSSSLSTSKWTESHRPRTEHPTEKDALRVARHELVEDRPQHQRPVQLLPDYMIVRDSERASRQQFRITSATFHQLPRSGLVVSPKFKSVGERPEDVYKAPDNLKHVPSLNLSRAGLKSAPTGYSQVCSVYVDGHRPMTQGAKRLQLLSPSSEVVAAKAAKQNMQARDLSALPAPLQEALLDRMGPYAGTVPMRTVAVPLLSRDFTQINRHLNIPNELMPESAAIDVTGEEHEGADESDTSVVAFQPLASLTTPRKLEQMTPRQRAAVWQSSECFNKLLVVLQQNAPSFRKHN